MGVEESNRPSVRQDVTDEAIFKVAKEIVVKFIEVGRISPANFGEHFADIYGEIRRTVMADADSGETAPAKKKKDKAD